MRKLAVLLLAAGVLLTAGGPLLAQRQCVKGIPCGNTCIARNRVCHVGTPTAPRDTATATAPSDGKAAPPPSYTSRTSQPLGPQGASAPQEGSARKVTVVFGAKVIEYERVRVVVEPATGQVTIYGADGKRLLTAPATAALIEW